MAKPGWSTPNISHIVDPFPRSYPRWSIFPDCHFSDVALKSLALSCFSLLSRYEYATKRTI